VAAAAPEPVMNSGQPEEQLRGSTHLVAQADLIPPDTPLAEISLPVQSLGDSVAAAVTSPVTPMTGHVAGALATSYASNSVNGNFSFDVSLSSGAISNGTLTASGTLSGGTYSGSLAVNLSGGTGMASSGMYPFFVMDSFLSGTVTVSGSPLTGTHASVKSPVDLLSAPSGYSFPVDYRIEDSGSNPIDYGTGTGTFTK
jgi:hypothetical protein